MSCLCIYHYYLFGINCHFHALPVMLLCNVKPFGKVMQLEKNTFISQVHILVKTFMICTIASSLTKTAVSLTLLN